jgi:hypothetical protein
MLVALPGQRVRCISCDHRFEAGAPSEPPPVERLPPLPAEEAPPPLPRPKPRRQQEADPPWPDGDRFPSHRFDVPLPFRPVVAEDEDGLPFCPGCGRRVRWEALVCPHCDEEFEDDRDLRPARRRRTGGTPRQDLPPHRGPVIANLGNLALIFGIFALCGGVSAVVGLPLGIIAMVMATGDLEAMRAGRLDGRGRIQTETGRGNAIAGIVVSAVFAVGWIVLWLWMH